MRAAAAARGPCRATSVHELIDDRRAAADVGRDRRAGDAELGKRPEAEDEAGAEHDVEHVAEPQHAHRDRGVAGAAEHRVDAGTAA